MAAAAAIAAPLSLEAYLHTSYSPDCDFVDGVLEERNLGEKKHAALQALIAAWFVNHMQEWSLQVLVEQRIRVADHRVRIANLCLLPADAPDEQVIQTAPLLCVEILSPDDRLARAKRVLDDYRVMGVHTFVADRSDRP